MECSKCPGTPVIFQPYSGQYLCQVHFIMDLEARVKRIIRQNQWMRPKDTIAVALTGDGRGEALLHFFQALAGQRRDIWIGAVPDQGSDADTAAAASRAGFTTLALPSSLEDEAVLTLSNLLQGRAERLWGGSGIKAGCVKIITPFGHIPAEEIACYGRLQGICGPVGTEHRGDDPLQDDVRALLADYTSRHPAAPYAVLNLCKALAAATGQTGGSSDGA